ncbi:spore maturation protein B [Thermolongibacillus altinsuensis]|uniref:Spore maturation protein B n=1 Tax=Thermolongibacillus altinsuensis TaxID=575256 RepID=A0A4R1QJT5_9BACL|nr:spore maturation protein [Thermolongibacillus altinsuensis]TCL53103.1 spore maturation protein B [Thermolongibacillus altinsuensis]GMB07806.1 spore maturation protein B [Thermolongibacillus altinsuensis]
MQIVQLISLWLIPSIIAFVLLYGTYKRVPTYEAFVEGGKEGIQIAFSLIPYLVGMLVSIAIFRTSGALDYFIQFVKPLVDPFGLPSEVIPLAIIRPISGTASLGIVTDLIATYGPDSFIGRLASTIQGSTETTLYVLTVYFGAVGIRKMGDALKVGLLADAISFILSFFIVLLIFGR